MKKYFAAGAVGVVAFAFAASAASFDVPDRVLASGTGDVTSCADDADVSYDYTWDEAMQIHRVETIRLTTDDDRCRSLIGDVQVLDADGNVLANVSNSLSWNGNASYSYWSWGGHSNGANPLDVKDIHGSAVVLRSR